MPVPKRKSSLRRVPATTASSPTTPPLRFVHLRTHSAFSLLEGALHLGRLIDLARADGQAALAVTDTTNLFGSLEFSQKAAAAGIQPIIGCQIPIVWKESLSGHRSSPLVFLAKDHTGYAHLIQLLVYAYFETPPDLLPHVTLERLAQFQEGILVLTGGAEGPIGALLLEEGEKSACAYLQRLKDIYRDRLYVEVQRHGMKKEEETEAHFIDFAYAESLPLVATNEPFFATKEEYSAHDALICIAEGKVVADPARRRLTPEHFFKTQAEMADLFADLPEALENTLEIARRCAFMVPKRAPILPKFVKSSSQKALELACSSQDLARQDDDQLRQEADLLRQQAIAGLTRRLAENGCAEGFSEADYTQRLHFELDVITTMRFPGYFLIVADFIQWAKKEGIPVGPGRGSGAGSLVAYALTITDLDPLRFGLLFERFLNPERVSMPDFDIDFCQENRDKVIAYVQQRYGRDRVAQIITFGSLQARVVLRDVGRVLQIPYGQVDRLCKMVPQNPTHPVSLRQAIEGEPRLIEARESEETVAQLLDISLVLEGLYRHASTHAAGIVIGDRPLQELVPLIRDPRSDMPVTQFNMKWVEQAGLVKFDFLGLKTLTVLNVACVLLAKRGIEVNISHIPLDDARSYALFASGETLGIFQLESQGMRRAIMGMKPDRFEDIIALVALYRPGPMDNIPTYNRRKHGEEAPEYLHPKLEPILKETFGIIVYQEQVMQIAQVLSGYSLGEADLLRRAMGKKIAEEMRVQRARFIEGAVARGLPKATAGTLFDLVSKFANYGFNKSHAAAYALVSYQTAWLKANYPIEFLAASMSLELNNTDKLADFCQEVRRVSIPLILPCINRSGVSFDVEKGEIIYALGALKGVGSLAAEHIVAVRPEGGFCSITDFANRVNPRIVNKRALESLIGAGAFDGLVPQRKALYEGQGRILAHAARRRENNKNGQGDMFESALDASPTPIHLSEKDEWTFQERLQREYTAVGFYLSAHPLDPYKPALETMGLRFWDAFLTSVKKNQCSSGRCAAVVTGRKERRTRSGKKMALVSLSDPTGHYEAVLFSEGLETYRDFLEVGTAVLLVLSAEIQEEGISARIDSVESLEQKMQNFYKKVRLFFEDSVPIPSLKPHLYEKGQGLVQIVLSLPERQKQIELTLPQRINLSPLRCALLRTVPGLIDLTLETGH